MQREFNANRKSPKRAFEGDEACFSIIVIARILQNGGEGILKVATIDRGES
jgi:hypothetical protein